MNKRIWPYALVVLIVYLVIFGYGFMKVYAVDVNIPFLKSAVKDSESLTMRDVESIRNSMTDEEFYQVWLAALKEDEISRLSKPSKNYSLNQMNETFVSYYELYDTIYPDSSYLKKFYILYWTTIKVIYEHTQYGDTMNYLNDLGIDSAVINDFVIDDLLKADSNVSYYKAHYGIHKKIILASFTPFEIGSTQTLSVVTTDVTYKDMKVGVAFSDEYKEIISDFIQMEENYKKTNPMNILRAIGVIEDN